MLLHRKLKLSEERCRFCKEVGIFVYATCFYFQFCFQAYECLHILVTHAKLKCSLLSWFCLLMTMICYLFYQRWYSYLSFYKVALCRALQLTVTWTIQTRKLAQLWRIRVTRDSVCLEETTGNVWLPGSGKALLPCVHVRKIVVFGDNSP